MRAGPAVGERAGRARVSRAVGPRRAAADVTRRAARAVHHTTGAAAAPEGRRATPLAAADQPEG